MAAEQTQVEPEVIDIPEDASMLDPNAQANVLLQVVDNLVKDDKLASFITAVLILVVTAVLAHVLTGFLRRVLMHENSPLPQSSIFVNIGRVVSWCLGLSVALSTCFGVDVSALVAALGVGGLALSLGSQDTISNLIGGLQLSIMGIVEPGDHIEMGGVRGVVKDVTWRQVTLETATGGLVVIPNQIINKNTFTRLPQIEKVVIPVNVTKDVFDLDLFAKRMEAAVAESVQKVATIDKPPVVLFDSTTEFGYSGNVVLWMSEEDSVLKVKDAAVRAIAPFKAEEFGRGEAAAAAAEAGEAQGA